MPRVRLSRQGARTKWPRQRFAFSGRGFLRGEAGDGRCSYSLKGLVASIIYKPSSSGPWDSRESRLGAKALGRPQTEGEYLTRTVWNHTHTTRGPMEEVRRR
ncbi:hypothetical protein LIA77_09916 [Sarocladium implicatum]|nr:hypothetical protein LIA77_09916 [Sarocladium implicatum]